MRVSVLNCDQIEAIDAASLGLLERVGVEVPHEETLRRFAERGAAVEFRAQRVRIPPELVRDCIRRAGKRFTLYGRDPAKSAAFGVGERNYNSIAGEAFWLDERSLTRRRARLDDVRAACLLGEGLPRLTVVGAMTDPHDVPRPVQDVFVAGELLKHATKPVTFWFNTRASARFIGEMLVALAGSVEEVARRPVTYNFLEPISPLRFPRDGVDLLYETARFPLPVAVGPMVQAGLSGPVTLAGAIAQENAEVLAGVCIAQLVSPGVPVCYGGIAHAFDMRTTQLVFAGPEQALMAVAFAQMGARYGLPVYVNVGLTDAKVPDAQAGMEAGITLAAGAAAGADIFGHLGICGVDQASSAAMLVMQHELIGYVERLMAGIEVTAETLAVDVVQRAVETGEGFLADEHTVRRFRAEHWFPELLDREFFQAWAEGGRLDMRARCLGRAEEILAGPGPGPPPAEVCAELDRIAEAALRELT